MSRYDDVAVANLRGVAVPGARLRGGSFDGCDIHGCDFRDSVFTGFRLRKAHLMFLDHQAPDFSGAWLVKCHVDVDLEHSDALPMLLDKCGFRWGAVRLRDGLLRNPDRDMANDVPLPPQSPVA